MRAGPQSPRRARARKRGARAALLTLGDSRDRKQATASGRCCSPSRPRSRRNGCANFSRKPFEERTEVDLRPDRSAAWSDARSLFFTILFSRRRNRERVSADGAAADSGARSDGGKLSAETMGQRGRAMDRARQFRRRGISGTRSSRRSARRSESCSSNRSARAQRAIRRSRSGRSCRL